MTVIVLFAAAPDKILEIEKILQHKRINGTILFQVKFKDRDIHPWLPLTELRLPCHNVILNYYISRDVSVFDLPVLNPDRRAKRLFDLLGNVSDDDLEQFVKRFDNFVLPPSQMDRLMQDLRQLHIDPDMQVLDNGYINKLRKRVLIEKCIQRRNLQIIELQEKEWQYNKISDNRWPLRMQNNRDFRVPPEFTYVNHYVPGNGINIPKAPPLNYGCGRESTSKVHKCKRTRTCACLKSFDSELAYNKDGLIDHGRAARGIRECNKMCRCDDTCPNKVVQKGCPAKLLIFRTANGTGWGVKTLEFLPRGMFIGKYVGKVILWEEGESLPEVEGRSRYLFDIDHKKEHDGHSKYTVDAFEYGNFTRFINHSCDPNLTVYNVWVDSISDDLHEIAFFTKRSIENGEELTFNYRRMLKDLLERCRCGSSRCVPITKIV